MKIYIALAAVLLKAPQMYSNSHAKLAPGRAINSLKFDPIQEFRPIVGGGTLVRIQYLVAKTIHKQIHKHLNFVLTFLYYSQ